MVRKTFNGHRRRCITCKDPRVVFWHRPHDIYKKVLKSEIKCYKKIEKYTLDRVLDMFHINPDEKYTAMSGEFIDIKKEAVKTYSYPVRHGSPIGKLIQLDPGDQINAAVLKVSYSNNKNETLDLFYALYNGLHISRCFCFGRVGRSF